MPQIDLSPVESSQIKRMGFDNGTMAVEFKNGDVWHYSGISQELYSHIRYSHSIGGTFAAVKNRLSGKKVS